jgi:outer membrane protein TolC
MALGVDIAKLELEKSKAARLPSLDLQGSYTRFSDPMIIVPIHETGVFPQLDDDIFSTGIYGQIPLYTGGRIAAANDMAHAQIEGSEQKREAKKQELIFSLVQTYAELLTLQDLLEAAGLRLEFYQKEQERIATLLAQGRATALDMAKINNQMENARLSHLQLQVSEDQNRVLLFNLMSVSAPQSFVPAPFMITAADLPATLGEALAVARLEHPVLREAAAQMRTAASKVKLEKSAGRPQLSAVGNARALSGGDFSSQNEWQLGLQFKIPLFDGNLTSKKVQQARIAESQSKLTLDALRNQTNAEIKNAWSAITASERTIVLARTGLVQAKEALRIEKLRYENDRATLNDLTLAETVYWEAQAGLARSENQLQLAKANLLRSMGVLSARNISSLS